MEWRASHILVKEKGLAEQILKRIKQGGRFDALAKEFSTCPSKSKGGDLGWFGPGKWKTLDPGAVHGETLRGGGDQDAPGEDLRRRPHSVWVSHHQGDWKTLDTSQTTRCSKSFS
jgi:hypothetical protein